MIPKKAISAQSQTDWERIKTMEDDDIDLSDCPEVTPEMFARAIVQSGLPLPSSQAQVTLRIDQDVLDWFSAQGKGYQTKINTLLREYYEGPSAINLTFTSPWLYRLR